MESDKKMKKKVHVLLVLDYINSNSGVSSVVMNYYNHINKAKVQMDFLLYEEPEKTTLDYLQEKGSKVYSFGHPVKTGLGEYRKLIKSFFKEHEGEYQIVHLHIPNAAFVVLKYAKKYGIVTRILHSHNTRGADEMVKKVRNYMLNRYGISYATHYFACSKLSGEYLYGKKQTDKITVINNATQLDKFRYSSQTRKKIRESLAISDEQLVLGHVGRFSKQKNHEFLIEIAKKLKEKQVDFKLLLLGGGELQESMKEQVRLYNLEEQVVFAGVVTNPNEYMDAMDLFLLPSNYEGLPCVCIEAQANGLPCMISANVTREAAISNFVSFYEISDVDIWVKEILEKYNHNQAELHRGEVPAGLEAYDIVVQAKKLEEKYLVYGEASDPNVNL